MGLKSIAIFCHYDRALADLNSFQWLSRPFVSKTRAHFEGLIIIIASHVAETAGATRKYIKYRIVNNCPNNSYGGSTGHPPIQVNRRALAINVQKSSCPAGWNASPCCLDVWVQGRIRRIKIAANIATTPPNLLGTDRRMAYAHRKYHSGLI